MRARRAADSGRGVKSPKSSILGDPSIPLLEGVILPWGEPDGYLRKVILPGLAKRYRFDLNTPWGQLSQTVREVLLYGAGGGKRRLGRGCRRWDAVGGNPLARAAAP